MFGTNPIFLANLLDHGMVLFGVLLVLYGAALTVVFLLRKAPELAFFLGVLTLLLLMALDGHVLLNFLLPSLHGVSASATRIVFLMLEHRWFLLELSGMLLLTSSIVLFVYGQRIVQAHAKDYLNVVVFSVLLSFAALLVSVLESTII